LSPDHRAAHRHDHRWRLQHLSRRDRELLPAPPQDPRRLHRRRADPVMGESVMAFVIPKSGETLTAEEIVEFARGTIANFKVPKHVEIVSEFPLTGSGKVQKFKQKAWAIERYGLRGPQ